MLSNFLKSFRLRDNLEKFCTAGQATDDNMAHARCMLGTKGYKKILFGIYNNYYFSTATIVTRKRLIITLIPTLTV